MHSTVAPGTAGKLSMEIPYTELAADILDAVIEEFVTREGTEYGEQEVSLATKIEQVRAQLRRGEVIITFDPESESVSLEPAGRKLA